MKIKKYITPLRGLVVLLNECYWKSFSGPFFTFFFPIIFIAILGWLMGYYMVLGGALGVSALSISLTSLPQAIYEFKSSTLLKRIGATPIKPILFIFVCSFFYILTMLISLFWTLFISIFIFSPYWNKAPDAGLMDQDFPTFFELLGNVNWGGFIISQLLTIIVGVSCGMMLVSIAKNSVTIQAFGVIIMIISMLLSANLVPIYSIKNISGLWYLGYFVSPFKSTTGMMIESWYHKNEAFFNVSESTIFDCSTSFKMIVLLPFSGMKFGQEIEIFSSAEKILNWFLPLTWISLFLTIATLKFKWTTR